MTAYLIAMMDVHDGAEYEEYRDKVPAFIAKHGGDFIVRGGAAEIVEGSWPCFSKHTTFNKALDGKEFKKGCSC